MLLDDFKRILTAFADSSADLDLSKGTLLVQVRDELIQASVFQHGGQLIVEEDGQRLPAFSWLVNRIARIPLLADRILSYVPDAPGFVTPSGRLLDQPDFAKSAPEGAHANAVLCALEVLGRHPGGTASFLYLTSDAGEGKTTLINHIARYQAAEFKAKRSDWLIVPIPLGGRTFLRFDDVVIAALVNRLRFQLLYYDAFIELVRLGVLVPAFDGFEEMIISSSSGEAISALGNLVRSLSSSGSVLVAARKAYFDYQSFKDQARLFDAIGTDSVAFARLALDRWSRGQFLEYAANRGLPDPRETYDAVAARLLPDHPLLTRAVLVRRLVEVAAAAPGVTGLLDQIGSAPQHYFFQFVNALIEREAHEKWIDQSGDPHQPLLFVEEHHELLSMVAQEMWLASTDALRPDVLNAVAEIFADSRHKPPALARQIRERLKQHSLLVTGGTSGGALAFDHEDFRAFYLGEAVGRLMTRHTKGELGSVLQAGVLPRSATDEAVLHIRRLNGSPGDSVAILQELANTESLSSVVRENCGALAIGLAEHVAVLELRNMSFPEDALRGRSLSHLVVRDSYFQATSLVGTRLQDCLFSNCRFERLEIHPDSQLSSVLDSCDVVMVVRVDRDEQVFDPAQIRTCLERAGLQVQGLEQPTLELVTAEPDEDLVLVERAMRLFLRANQVNEDVIRTKLGVKASRFFDAVLPELLGAGVLEQIQYLGHGSQRRFRLRTQMQKLHDALAACSGGFQRFLSLVKK